LFFRNNIIWVLSLYTQKEKGSCAYGASVGSLRLKLGK
jgi:hypothetical protein